MGFLTKLRIYLKANSLLHELTSFKRGKKLENGRVASLKSVAIHHTILQNDK